MIERIAAQIRGRIGERRPKTAVLLGSGLGKLADEITAPVVIPYAELEGFPQSTVSGHRGQLIIGRLEGREVLCLQGRFHLYEGIFPSEINKVIKVLQVLGIKTLIVTNAAGSLNYDLAPGSIMLITDHINLCGTNPLIGPDDETFGPRFPDMSNAYDSGLRQKLLTAADRQKLEIGQGVYLMVSGPTFETPAEIRAFRTLGADAVGMSTVPEVICAVHSGIKVLGLSVITNFGTGMKTGPQSHAETLEQGQRASENLIRLVKGFLGEMNDE